MIRVELIQIMERIQSEPKLPPNNDLNLNQSDESVDRHVSEAHRLNISASASDDQRVKTTSKVISSRTSGHFQRQVASDPEIISRADLKMLITQEDQDKINACKETVARAKEFRLRQKELNFSQPLVSEFEVRRASGDQDFVYVSGPSEMDHFLHSIDEIIHADPLKKHEVEIAEVEKITRVIKSADKGEQCRDVLRFISNLRKQFNECLIQLDSLTTQSASRYSKIKEVQTQQNNALSTEIVKVQKLTQALKSREQENSHLKKQLEQLLEQLYQRDQQRSEGAKSEFSNNFSNQLVDEKREQDIQSLSQRLEQELSSNKALALMERLKQEMSLFIQENMKLKISAHQTEMRFEAQARNLTYLEEKLAKALTEREEQVVDLKSQIVISKQKAKSLKQKLNFELDEFKKQNLKQDQENCYKEKQVVEMELAKAQAIISERDSEIREHEQQAERHKRRIEEIQKQFTEQLESRELKYQGLKDQLHQMERDHQIKFKSQLEKVAQERRAMDRFEQEQTVKELRLEYLESNQKKMQQQKEFLEKQVSKDIRQMQQQMMKTKLEIKKDQLISSQSALQRLEQLYAMMQQSLRHVTRVVSFMTFDVESQHLNTNEFTEPNEAQDHPKVALQPGTNIFNENVNQALSAEQLVIKHPYELLESLAQWFYDLWTNANVPPSDELDMLLNQLRHRTSSTKVDEISKNFLITNRLHFDQHIFRLNEKSSALQVERDRLQKKIQEMHQEMEEIMRDYGDENLQEFVKEPLSAQLPGSEQTIGVQDVGPENSARKFIQKKAGLTNNFHLKAQITKRLNEALTERVRDIKLILNRKYFELEDQMKLQKDKYEQEISQMRVQYGKDLNQVHLDCKKALHLQRKEQDEVHKVDFQRLKNQFSEQFKKLKLDFEDALKKLNKEKKQERHTKQEYFKELKKQKRESCGLYSGGYGTFTIAFENPVHAKLLKCQQQLADHQQDLDILKQSLQGAKAKIKAAQLHAHAEKERELQEEWKQLQSKMEKCEIIPTNKLNHFIEVGFQISQRNYQPLMTYNDQAYESMAKKYVFEFQDNLDTTTSDNESEDMQPTNENNKSQQSSFEASKLLQKENLLRQQISDNFALFNEINPIYISLNLGRPVSTFPDVSLPIENFRLCHRISANVCGQLLTINFMKADFPFVQLRIIAFNNQTCQSYELDLLKDDLLVFLESNLKLLEEENIMDLFNLLANSFTIITRKTNQRSGVVPIQVLTVEHRCFFNELYRQNWDARNRKIKARHNKFKQGLVQSVECITDYPQSVLYEGFENVFDKEITLDLAEQQADHFLIRLQRGVHSGHLKLLVKLLHSGDIEQTLCLMKSLRGSDSTIIDDQGKSQNLTCTLIQKPDMGDQNQAIAYIVSMEKIFGSSDDENVLIKITSLQKKFTDKMSEFKWQGQGPPNVSSTKAISELIYLTKKAGEPNIFCEVKDFDVLNTEVRAQLFSHAFGYQQVTADFGDLSTQSSDNSLHNKSQELDVSQKPNRLQKLLSAPPVELEKNHSKIIFRQFTIIRLRQLDDDKEQEILSAYAHVAFITSIRLQELNQVRVEVDMPEQGLQLSQDLVYPQQLISVDEFNNNINVETHARAIIDHIVVQTGEKAQIEIDLKLQSFSFLIQQMKQSQFDEMMAKIGNVQFQLEFQNTRDLQISKSDLVDCPKTHSMALIGQRPFKVTCYFIPSLVGIKPKKREKFEFDCIIVQCFSVALDRTFEIAITEHDIGTLVEMLQEATQHRTAVDCRINCAKLYNSKLTKKQLMSFILELLQFDSSKQEVIASFEQLLEKTTERQRLEVQFIECGGQFVQAEPVLAKSSEYAQGLLTRILIQSFEKDLSNSKIFIRVYKCTLQSLPGLSKLQVEIFDIEEPSIVFRIDYLTSQENIGKQLLVERFSLADAAFRHHNKEQNIELNENGLNRGLIFSISETSFPHEIHLMLLEPCSHIFWYQTVKDDKINKIERRADRQAFAVHLEKSLTQEIYRNIPLSGFREVLPGYQKREKETNTSMQLEIMTAQRENLGAKHEGDLDLVYGRTFWSATLNCFVEIRMYFSYKSKKLSVEWFEKDQEEKLLNQITWQLSILGEAESSRFYQGNMRAANGTRLICQLEQACAKSGTDCCLRVSFHKMLQMQDQLETVFDLVIVEPQLLKSDQTIREDKKYELGIGYKDTLASIFKMDDLASDIAFSKVQLLPQSVQVSSRTDPWSLVYRRVVQQNEKTYIVSATQHTQTQMLKLNVFEQLSMQQQIFVFNKEDVFTAQEISEIDKIPGIFKEKIKIAVNQRLKIRELTLAEEEKQRIEKQVVPFANSSETTFSVSFLNPAMIQNQKQNKIAINLLLPGIEAFDIRKECVNSFFEPTNIFQDSLSEKRSKSSLLCQFQRDNQLYDVHQLLDPFELKLKVQVFNLHTFQLVASALINEQSLKRELQTDSMQHLLEGQAREQLAEYLVNNSHLDEKRQLTFFYKSLIKAH